MKLEKRKEAQEEIYLKSGGQTWVKEEYQQLSLQDNVLIESIV